MYAPRPQTHQIPRHYTSNPTGTIHRTSHRNTEKENANALPSKTPSRAAGGGKAVSLAPGTGVRMGLGAKTVGRDRNVLGGGGGGSGVVGGKGKGKEGDEIGECAFVSIVWSRNIVFLELRLGCPDLQVPEEICIEQGCIPLHWVETLDSLTC